MMFEIMLVILLAAMSIELALIARKIKHPIPTIIRNEYDDRFDEINEKLNELIDGMNKKYYSPFGRDAAGVHDY